MTAREIRDAWRFRAELLNKILDKETVRQNERLEREPTRWEMLACLVIVGIAAFLPVIIVIWIGSKIF